MEDLKQWQIDQLKKLHELLVESQSIRNGTPDQYQYRQNLLAQAVAEFILTPFYQWEHKQYEAENGQAIQKAD